ncbi:DUF5063 domain-containing protein [Seonamhaeicola algicola]|uniref:DUF5063 domain-containing protein n=1 Tax=Seonamhaeicola algicola TaxID=1719036 RepID=A0A5C7B5J8_9FLAO|nr:DUF5063 domain-containing protein [Seonamhaeicola algicola]TXE13815.1 DUF5063 domain-containing protein [Seonamhaeicola algicola]
MSNLRELIDKITEFGINPKVELTDKTDVLKKLLVGIYSEYLNVEFELDETDYDDSPEFNYNEIKENVKSNFTDLDWYSTVLDLNKMEPYVEIGIGDSIDDLSDIIKDLLVVKWKMENTSEMDALWEFNFSMKTHSEQHLIDLLKYLNEKE